MSFLEKIENLDERLFWLFIYFLCCCVDIVARGWRVYANWFDKKIGLNGGL